MRRKSNEKKKRGKMDEKRPSRADISDRNAVAPRGPTRARARAALYEKQERWVLHAGKHPSIRCVRAHRREVRRRGRTAAPTVVALRPPPRCFRGAFAYPLVYTFSISSRGGGGGAQSVRARNCATSGSLSLSLPYRRYVVANLRALAI